MSRVQGATRHNGEKYVSDFPRGHEALVKSGYAFLGGAICKSNGCGFRILWYRHPSGHAVAVDVDSKLPHWKVCIGENSFRKRRVKPEKPKPPTSPQGSLFGAGMGLTTDPEFADSLQRSEAFSEHRTEHSREDQP